MGRTKGSTGDIRALDFVGRIVIPSEIRSTLGIEERDTLEMWADLDCECLYIRKPKDEIRGIVRKMDPVGRLTISSGIRKVLGLKHLDQMSFQIEKDMVMACKTTAGHRKRIRVHLNANPEMVDLLLPQEMQEGDKESIDHYLGSFISQPIDHWEVM